MQRIHSSRRMLDPSNERLVPVRIACQLTEPGLVAELQSWVSGHGDAMSMLPNASDSEPWVSGVWCAQKPDVVVLDAANVETLFDGLSHYDLNERPELVVVGLSRLAALRLRDRGLPFLMEVSGEWSLEAVFRAIEHIVLTRLPLRALARALVGHAELHEAMALLRHAMLNEALVRCSSKRAAARVLGVTRPAIQHMAKGYGTRLTGESQPRKS